MVTISEISRIRSRYCIELDNGDKVFLSGKSFTGFPYSVHDTVGRKELYHYFLLKQYPDALNRAIALLAVRVRSRKEIETALQRAGYLTDTVEMVVVKLKILKLLNDKNFCDLWIKDQIAKKKGPDRIRKELVSKGISRDMIESSLTQYSRSFLREQASSAISKKMRSSQYNLHDPSGRNKLIMYLVRRGYSWSVAKEALDRWLSDQQEK